jgi:hypothetical protein
MKNSSKCNKQENYENLVEFINKKVFKYYYLKNRQILDNLNTFIVPSHKIKKTNQNSRILALKNTKNFI